MPDFTTGSTGADSPEDIRDEPALESVGVDPDAPIAQDAADEPGQDEEDDEFDDDEEEADEEEDADDEDAQQASDEDKE